MAGQERDLTLRFLAQPKDVNYGGKAFGGAVMGWIDQAAYALAAGWSGHYCVTVYVGGIQFEAPVPIGSLVEVRARLLLTGTSSMHIGVDVHARDPRGDASSRVRTTHCIVVFVAMDSDGRSIAVPAYTPQTEEEQELQAYARRVAELRKAVERERVEFLAKAGRGLSRTR
ncbi:MAG: acyl-CoA thioesterase [Lysobacterales bacterium]|nr:acyl-CoA thioesterase [Xanthomonadales bacterium]